MLEDAAGFIDYDDTGSGPAVLLVPGSCSTGAAWRPVMTAWNGQFRCITTSLLGYGGTAERRSAQDTSIAHEAEIVEAVIRHAATGVHLVGHSFGGLVSLATVLRQRVPVKSLTIAEAPAVGVLAAPECAADYAVFRQMTDVYMSAFDRREPEAISIMIDFYGGEGTFASWPDRVRGYAVATTHVNILDWASAYGFPLPADHLAAIDIPVLVIKGGASPPAVQRTNARLGLFIRNANVATVADAAHFMITTHASETARLIADHVKAAERA